VAPAIRATDNRSRTVSVNTATADELASVKGLPAKVAEAIVAKRPYASLDDLLRVKGMGAKLLAKLRSRLKL
jgi:competence ComEA-like helix-hairpin-helix protein